MSRAPAVVAHIQGGLGNQLFCYAMGRAMALRAGLPLRINTLAGYRNEVYGRDCQLRAFNIEAPETGWWEGFRGPMGRSRRSWARKLNAKRPITERALIQEPKDQTFLPELLDLKPARAVYLVGYWQDERYFADAIDTLRKDLTLRKTIQLKPDSATDELSKQPDTVSVHCRSYGEVAQLEPGVRLDAAYYDRAFAAVLERVPDARFLVFSDKPDWARQLIEATAHADRVSYAPGIDADATTATLTDFTLMSRCKHHVLANSSFSWWTGWLGEREGSVIIAPPNGLPGSGRGYPDRWLLTSG